MLKETAPLLAQNRFADAIALLESKAYDVALVDLKLPDVSGMDILRRAPDVRTVQVLARVLGVVPSSLMSRFYRSRLPSPKTYLAFARLLHAAYLFRCGGLSIADVANRLDYSSPQSFGRHLRTFLGVTAGEFRRRLPFEAAIERFRLRLLAPHRDRLLAFHPFGTWPGNHGQTAA